MKLMQQGNPQQEALHARAYYFECLLGKTTDPVYWSKEKLLAAQEALYAARQRGYECTTAMAQLTSAISKASYPNLSIE